ncbi:MAG: hypothetical protein KIS79_13835 [Burkholderiales bacterium]|nr:hypothetical protein [Burkholderiales bacterium]
MKHFAAAGLAIIAAGMVAFAQAHPDADADAPEVIDCRRPPADAVTELPAPLNRWARLECQPSSQFLVQSADWSWRYPASFTTPVLIPAWTPDPARAAVEAHYFVAAQLDRMTDQQAQALHERLAREVAVYGAMTGTPEQSPVREVYALRAQNNHGEHFDVYFMYRSEQDVWGLVCAPQCKSEFSFLMSARN